MKGSIGITNPTVLVIFLLFLQLASSAASFDIDSLLAISVGGDKGLKRLATVKTISVYGLVDLNGMVGNFKMYNLIPDKLYLEVDFGGFVVAQGYDGTSTWQRDQNGAYHDLSGFEADELKSQAYTQSFSYLFDERLPGGIEYQGVREYENDSYHVVSLFPFGNDTVVCYYNLSTGLQELAFSIIDNLEVVSHQSDFREVEGVTMAFQSVTTSSTAPIRTSFKADSIIFDKHIDKTLFIRPSIVTRDYYFPREEDSIIVPFKYITGHIYIPVKLNGSGRLWFILDSGASSNMYHLPVIESLNLPIIGSLPAKGIGDYEEVMLVQTDSVVIGDLKLFSQVGGALDLTGIGKAEIDGDPLGGVLGYDFLSRFPIMLDYIKQQLVIYSPEKFQPSDSGSVISFELTMQVPTIDAELIGIQGKFLVDLGNSLGLLVHPKFISDHNLKKNLDNLTELPGGVGGIGGVLKGESAYATSFSFGGVRLESLRIILLETGVGLSGSNEIAGNIGNLILSQFKILLDYQNRSLVFYKNEMKAN